MNPQEILTAQTELRANPTSFSQREEFRLAMADRGKRDLYYLCSVILGYNKLTPHTHGPLCRFLDTCGIRRRMIMMPRTHYKTTIKTIGDSIKWIINDPNITILIANAVHENASRMLVEIQRHFERNEVLRWLYPEICYENPRQQAPRWNKLEMEVKRSTFVREPTIDTIGAGGEATSRHYLAINLDDIIGERQFKSPAEMTAITRWLEGVESLLVPPWHERQLDNTGTRWKLDDSHGYFEYRFGGNPREVPTVPLGPHAVLRGNLAIFTRPVREDGKPIFPEQYTNEILDDMQRQSPERFAAQMLNDPLAEGTAEFRAEWLKYYKWQPDGRILLEEGETPIDPVKCPTFILCDPSLGEHRRSNRTAIHVVAVHLGKEPRLIMLDSFVERIPPDRIIDKLFELYDRFKWTRTVSIETVAFQKALKYWIEQREVQERRPPLPIFEYKPGTAKDSVDRIKGLQPLCRAGQLYIQEGFHEFLDEYVRWHPQATDQDALDSLAQILEHIDFGWTKQVQSELDEWNKMMLATRNNLTGYW